MINGETSLLARSAAGASRALHDRDQPAALVHHARVAARLVELGHEDRGGARVPAVRAHQPLQVVAGHGIEVAADHEHVLRAADGLLGLEHRVAGPELLGLLDEDRLRLQPPRLHRRADLVGAVAHDHDDLRSASWRARPAGRATARACRRWDAGPWAWRTSAVCPCLPRAPPRRAFGRASCSRPTARPEVEGPPCSGMRAAVANGAGPPRRPSVPGGGIGPPFQAPKARVLPLDDPGLPGDYPAGGPDTTNEPGTAWASRSACPM